MWVLRVFIVFLCFAYLHAREVTFINETALLQEVMLNLKASDSAGVGVERRSLVIYRIGETSKDDGLDVVVNNIRIFAAAVESHNSSAHHQAFYVFRVVGGKRNSLSRHLPSRQANVVFTRCTHGDVDLPVHIHTINLLGEAVVSKFHSVLFLDQYSRGPFEERANGQWWNRITSVFDDYPQVGMVGSSISCEVSPHVQSHAFAMRSSAAVQVFAEFHPHTAAGKKNKDVVLETGVTATALNLGYNISSLIYQRRWHETVFSECHNAGANHESLSKNPVSWCATRPEDALFVKFGGPQLSQRGYYCQETLDLVQQATMKIALQEPALHLALPETLTGGPLHGLSREFDLESYRPMHSEIAQKVCFLVRSAIMHGRNASTGSRVVRMDVDLFITTLLRQSNPNWDAYFFVTDDQPFDEELKGILAERSDNRLKFLNIDAKFRLKVGDALLMSISYHPADAAYPASDEAMRIIAQKPECVRLTVTNADNAYGSDVVESILSPTTPKADLILLPMDSRNFANEDIRMWRDQHGWQLHLHQCMLFEQKHKENPYGFARMARPTMGGVDIAAVFIQRDKFLSTGVYFNEFSSAKVAVCVGCQDGAWVDNMVNKRGWTTYIAPFNGLKRMIFHGPSPLWCVASGNVWFDHTWQHVSCISHKTVGTLQGNPDFDLDTFYQPGGMKICLRLSKVGHDRRDKPETIIT